MELSALNAIHFLHPAWLLSLPPLWLIATWFAWRGGREGNWAQVIDTELLSALRLEEGGGRSHSPWALIGLVWTLAVLALASPAWQREESPAFRASDDWIVVLDLSPSMAATDLTPDRATRARYAIEDLLNSARDTRVSLVVFSGEAHTVSPLTTDMATVRSLLPPLAPSIMPETGDRLAPALVEAAGLLRGAASRHAQVVVLSDGFVDPAQALQAAQALRQQGATLHVVGVGTTNGAPQPDGRGNFVHDEQDRPVLARLPTDQLQRVADAGGGDYVPLSQLSELILRLNNNRAGPIEQDHIDAKLRVKTWRNGGFWLLPPLLALAALLARRGWI